MVSKIFFKNTYPNFFVEMNKIVYIYMIVQRWGGSTTKKLTKIAVSQFYHAFVTLR